MSEVTRTKAKGTLDQAFETLRVDTRGPGLYLLTEEVAGWLGEIGAIDGLLTLFIRHTSASLLIQENADPRRADRPRACARPPRAARRALRARRRGRRRHAGAHQVGADGNLAVDPGARRGACCSAPGRASTSSSIATARITREVVLHYLGTRAAAKARRRRAEAPRRRDELVNDAGLAHGVAGVGHDAQLGSGPGGFQVPGVLDRRHHVVAAVHDRRPGCRAAVRVAQELAVGVEEAAVDEVVALDAGERERVGVGAEAADALGVLEAATASSPPRRSRPWPPRAARPGRDAVSRRW